MKIELSRNSNVSLIDQIFFEISERIDSKLLKEGTPLPSVRQLAHKSHVSLVTVHKAYARLAKEGYIDTYRGKGAYVRERSKQEPQHHHAVKHLSPLDWQQNIADYIHRAQLVQYLQFSNPIQFATSVVYPKLLPIRFLGETTQAILQEDPSVFARYSETQGDPELREAIQRLLQQAYQMRIPYEQIMITTGVQQGIDLVARSFIGPGDVVIMEAPCYTGAIDAMRSRGASIFTVPVKQDGLCLSSLEELCEKVKPKLIYTNPTFQNPTGTVMSERNRQTLLDIAEYYGALIIEDDSVGELYFDEQVPPKPIKYWDKSGHVIYLKGFSKQLSPGCRLSTLVASGIVMERLIAAKCTADICTPLIAQKAVLAFLRSDKMSTHLQKLRIALEVRRDRLQQIFSNEVGDRLSYLQPPGGLNLWIKLPEQVNTDELLFQAAEQNLSFLPGSACYVYNPQRNYLRLSFSSVSDKELDEGAERFCRLIKSLD